MNTECPRCGARMKGWRELEQEEREIVRRLPASAEEHAPERQRLHRWCTRCWYESRSEERTA